MHIISGQWKGRPLMAPKGTGTRPTSSRLRESLFDICNHKIGEARVLDLFAGTGAIGLEALSRNAASVCFIDNNREAIKCIKSNLQTLQAENMADVIFGDVFQQLDRLEAKGKVFDVIYADPPYDLIVVRGEERLPCAHALLKRLDGSPLLAPHAWVFLEDSVKGLLEIPLLHHLELDSRRKAGRSALLHFKSKTPS